MSNKINNIFDFELEIEDLTPLSYNFLKGLFCGDAVIAAAVNRWGSLGFLDGILGETIKEQLSVAFDNIAYRLLTESEGLLNIASKYNSNLQYVDFEVAIFPLLRRVVTSVNEFDYDTFINSLEHYSFLSINEEVVEDFDEFFDADAEYISALATLIIGDFDRLYNDENKDDSEV